MRKIPVPDPGDRDVRIAVRAIGVSPVDVAMRNGDLRFARRYALPVVAGAELSGVVEAVGESVTRFRVGDDVFARGATERLGAFAEAACVDERHVAKMPRSVDFVQAAAIPNDALTALQVLRDELRVTRGMRVFVPRGVDSVGTFALQIAKHFGALVATTASQSERGLVQRLGADVVVDDAVQDFRKVLGHFDAVFDVVGHDTLARAFSVVRRGGTVLSIAGTPAPDVGGARAALFWLLGLGRRLRAWRSGVTYRSYAVHPSGKDLEMLASLVDEHELEVVVDRVYRFAKIADALAYVESGEAKGKVIVTMP